MIVKIPLSTIEDLLRKFSPRIPEGPLRDYVEAYFKNPKRYAVVNGKLEIRDYLLLDIRDGLIKVEVPIVIFNMVGKRTLKTPGDYVFPEDRILLSKWVFTNPEKIKRLNFPNYLPEYGESFFVFHDEVVHALSTTVLHIFIHSILSDEKFRKYLFEEKIPYFVRNVLVESLVAGGYDGWNRIPITYEFNSMKAAINMRYLLGECYFGKIFREIFGESEEEIFRPGSVSNLYWCLINTLPDKIDAKYVRDRLYEIFLKIKNECFSE